LEEVKGKPAPARLQPDNTIKEVRLVVSGLGATATGKPETAFLWSAAVGSLPGASSASAIVVEVGRNAAFLGGEVKKRFERAEPAQTSMPQQGMLGPLLQGVQQIKERARPVGERTAKLSVIGFLLSAGVQSRSDLLCAAEARRVGAIGYPQAPRITILTRREAGRDQFLSLQSLGTPLNCVASPGMPACIEAGLISNAAFVEDAVKTGALEKASGARVASFTTVMNHAKTSGIRLNTYCKGNVSELDALPLDDATKRYARQRVQEGAVVMTFARPVAIDGEEFEAMATVHSPVKLMVFRKATHPSPLLDSRAYICEPVAVCAAADIYLRRAIEVGVAAWSLAEIGEMIISPADYMHESAWLDLLHIIEAIDAVTDFVEAERAFLQNADTAQAMQLAYDNIWSTVLLFEAEVLAKALL
jgi:hypothetical protein